MTAGVLHQPHLTLRSVIDETNEMAITNPTMTENVKSVRTPMKFMFVKEVSTKINLNEEDGTKARSSTMLVDGSKHEDDERMIGAYMSACNKVGKMNASLMYDVCPGGSMVPVSLCNIMCIVTLEHTNQSFDEKTNRFTDVRIAATKRLRVSACPELYEAEWFKSWLDLSSTISYPIPSPSMDDEGEDKLPSLVVKVNAIAWNDPDSVDLHVEIKDSNVQAVMSIYDQRKVFQTDEFKSWVGKYIYVGTGSGVVAKTPNEFLIPTNAGIIAPDLFMRLMKTSSTNVEEVTEPKKMKIPIDPAKTKIAAGKVISFEDDMRDDSDEVMNARNALAVAEAKLASTKGVVPRITATELMTMVEERDKCANALKLVLQNPVDRFHSVSTDAEVRSDAEQSKVENKPADARACYAAADAAVSWLFLFEDIDFDEDSLGFLYAMVRGS